LGGRFVFLGIVLTPFLPGIVYVDSALPLTRNDKRPDRVEIDPLQMHNACVPVVDAANKRRAVDKTVQQHPAGTSVRRIWSILFQISNTTESE
jgi:hypothetical protein